MLYDIGGISLKLGRKKANSSSVGAVVMTVAGRETCGGVCGGDGAGAGPGTRVSLWEARGGRCRAGPGGGASNVSRHSMDDAAMEPSRSW